ERAHRRQSRPARPDRVHPAEGLSRRRPAGRGAAPARRPAPRCHRRSGEREGRRALMGAIMSDYLMLMHNDPARAASEQDWETYFAALQRTGKFRGGSAIGTGVCRRKVGAAPPITAQIGGYIRIEADSLADVEALLAGNPVYENGGTVELRELP